MKQSTGKFPENWEMGGIGLIRKFFPFPLCFFYMYVRTAIVKILDNDVINVYSRCCHPQYISEKINSDDRKKPMSSSFSLSLRLISNHLSPSETN